MITPFVLTIIIVGVVTAGLTIKFDRFFAILLLMFLFKYTIFDAVNIFLWIIMMGALMIILDNREKIAGLPKQMKIKMFVLIPVFTLIASLLGTLVFRASGKVALIVILGILAILYGLRLIFIHFKPEEVNLDPKNQRPVFAMLCSFIGPWISGFSIGLIGTSLKPLKIPLAIKVGRMNAKSTYLGNTVTTFFASSFAIMWHAILTNEGSTGPDFYEQMILGTALWTGIHYFHELTNLFYKEKWKKVSQIVVGIVLAAMSIKIFMLI